MVVGVLEFARTISTIFFAGILGRLFHTSNGYFWIQIGVLFSLFFE